jgi:hypothetical protein
MGLPVFQHMPRLPCLGSPVSDEWDLNDLIGRVEEEAAIMLVVNMYYSPPIAFFVWGFLQKHIYPEYGRII